MKKLVLEPSLKEEFESVVSVWNSAASTRRVDSFILCWVKYEKQLRRLFCFLVFQHPKLGEEQIDDIIDALVEERQLFPREFMIGIEQLGGILLSDLIGPSFSKLESRIVEIKKYRNKLLHGQISGQKLTSLQLERDVLTIIKWIGLLAVSAEKTFGYDGLKRNTYRVAKSTERLSPSEYPFKSAKEFEPWLSNLSKSAKQPRAKAGH